MDCVLVGKSEGWIGEYRKQINNESIYDWTIYDVRLKLLF